MGTRRGPLEDRKLKDGPVHQGPPLRSSSRAPSHRQQRTPCRTGPRPNEPTTLQMTGYYCSRHEAARRSEYLIKPASPPFSQQGSLISRHRRPPFQKGPLLPSTSRTWNPAPPPISAIQDRRSKMHGTGDDPANPAQIASRELSTGRRTQRACCNLEGQQSAGTLLPPLTSPAPGYKMVMLRPSEPQSNHQQQPFCLQRPREPSFDARLR